MDPKNVPSVSPEVRETIQIFARARITLPEGLCKIIILDEVDSMTTVGCNIERGFGGRTLLFHGQNRPRGSGQMRGKIYPKTTLNDT